MVNKRNDGVTRPAFVVGVLVVLLAVSADFGMEVRFHSFLKGADVDNTKHYEPETHRLYDAQ